MNNTLTIPQLQPNWISLHDLDRAAAVRSIHRSGTSLRQIASQLHKSESSLRHLLIALDAPASDRMLARQGKLSTNELVRRSHAAGLRRATRHREEIELKRARQTLKAADLICKWLLQTGLNTPNCEMIIDEVRRQFHGMASAGLHPPRLAPPDLTVDQIIERTKPPALQDDSIDIVSWFAQWLLHWSFFAFSDEDIRNHALDLALERQWT